MNRRGAEAQSTAKAESVVINRLGQPKQFAAIAPDRVTAALDHEGKSGIASSASLCLCGESIPAPSAVDVCFCWLVFHVFAFASGAQRRTATAGEDHETRVAVAPPISTADER